MMHVMHDLQCLNAGITLGCYSEDLASPPILPPSSPTMTARRQRKSSLRQSARLAQRSVLKDLGIVRNDGSSTRT